MQTVFSLAIGGVVDIGKGEGGERFKFSSIIFFSSGLGFENSLCGRAGSCLAGVFSLAVGAFGLFNCAFVALGAWMGVSADC